MGFNVGAYLRHTVVVALGILLFYILASKRKQILESVFSITDPGKAQLELGELLFTETELSKFNGKERDLLYLVILGHVYDVTAGLKHYGPGQSYHMFVGHDATRSFVTGEFDEYSSELSDVSSLKETELQQLITWKEFYDKTYRYVGKLIGRYFDSAGQPTAYYQHVLDRAAKANDSKDNERQYPSCNVEWKLEMGTRVWCTNRSGTGQERSWIGRPRKVVTSAEADGAGRGSEQYCACVPEGNNDEQYVPFPGCDSAAESCIVPDQN
ncbi:neuferricin homolog [Anopheles stephensi]|uniref:Cytochrome b5 heme-binding domain-containing protein n=1 Tax=Anopheles stephensi TaxID=30069 RepID=A0A182YH50_ANOST|nr:neuferricin homolog [Anopheles stephensi]